MIAGMGNCGRPEDWECQSWVGEGTNTWDCHQWLRQFDCSTARRRGRAEWGCNSVGLKKLKFRSHKELSGIFPTFPAFLLGLGQNPW